MRLTIRDLFWLTLVVVLVVGWGLDHRATTNRLDYCVEALEQTTRELDDAKAESNWQINALRANLTDAQAATARARREARREEEINALLSSPPPGQLPGK
jgi:hypothetical protein